MVQALCGMHRAGADVCKLAVMPRTAADAAALLFATARARDLLPRRAADHHVHGGPGGGHPGVWRGLRQLGDLRHGRGCPPPRGSRTPPPCAGALDALGACLA